TRRISRSAADPAETSADTLEIPRPSARAHTVNEPGQTPGNRKRPSAPARVSQKRSPSEFLRPESESESERHLTAAPGIGDPSGASTMPRISPPGPPSSSSIRAGGPVCVQPTLRTIDGEYPSARAPTLRTVPEQRTRKPPSAPERDTKPPWPYPALESHISAPSTGSPSGSTTRPAIRRLEEVSAVTRISSPATTSA